MKALSGALVVLVLDQITKAVVVHTMFRGQSIQVIGDFFRLTYIRNPGAAFGLNLGSPLVHTLVSLVALAALGWLFWSTPSHQRSTRIALGLILGGAVGNILDRVRYREVVDFLDFGLGSMRWPIFNVADMFVTLGVAYIILFYSRHDKSDRACATDSSQSSREPGAPH